MGHLHKSKRGFKSLGLRQAVMRAAIYCRLSEEDRNKRSENDDSGSIQNQKSMLLQYAMSQGWEVYNIYSDDDYAGADRLRPEFNRLLRDAELRRFEVVLCKTQSRFTRELELVEKYIHGLFQVWGIRFVSIVDNADTANKGNKKSRQINGLVNEWYLEDMSENIRSVLKNRRESGFHIGAFAPYGYQKDAEQKGRLVIDEEAAAVVREVFILFSQGYGKTAIARMLNDRGIPNPTEYKRRCGLRYRRPDAKNSTLWKYPAISAMLVNEVYTGSMVQGRYGSISYKTKKCAPRPKSEWYIVKGTHQAIIEPELWDRVQSLVAERSKPFSAGTIGLFAGKARCAGCGYTMRSTKTKGRYYLRCPNRHVAKDACAGSFISVDKLERYVACELARLSAEYVDKDELAESIVLCGGLQAERLRLRGIIASYEKKMAEFSRCIRELYIDKLKGVIPQSAYVELSEEFTSEHSRLERMVADMGQQLAVLERKLEAGDDRADLAARYLSDCRLDREAVDLFIDYILVHSRIPGTRDVPVEIHWDF